MEVTALIEILLKKDTKFQWEKEFQESIDKVKNKMAIAPIFVFRYWTKEFHAYANASSIVIGMVLMRPSEGSIDHPISFASRKL